MRLEPMIVERARASRRSPALGVSDPLLVPADVSKPAAKQAAGCRRGRAGAGRGGAAVRRPRGAGGEVGEDGGRERGARGDPVHARERVREG
jgi:hypothetical protein